MSAQGYMRWLCSRPKKHTSRHPARTHGLAPRDPPHLALCAVQAAVAIILEGQLNDAQRVDGRAIGAAIGRRVFIEYYTLAP